MIRIDPTGTPLAGINDQLDHLVDDLADVHRQTLREWAGDSRNGLGVRLSERAWALYGFTPRSDRYTERLLKVFGKILPYVSPKLKAKGGGPYTGKFIWNLTKENTGHRVFAGPRHGSVAESILTVRSARGLNFSRNGGVYLREWHKAYPTELRELTVRASLRATPVVRRWTEAMRQKGQTA